MVKSQWDACRASYKLNFVPNLPWKYINPWGFFSIFDCQPNITQQPVVHSPQGFAIWCRIYVYKVFALVHTIFSTVNFLWNKKENVLV